MRQLTSISQSSKFRSDCHYTQCVWCCRSSVDIQRAILALIGRCPDDATGEPTARFSQAMSVSVCILQTRLHSVQCSNQCYSIASKTACKKSLQKLCMSADHCHVSARALQWVHSRFSKHPVHLAGCRKQGALSAKCANQSVWTRQSVSADQSVAQSVSA